MLKRLSLQNFVLVDEAQIEFADGLQVLTGETGAGKSVVVGALTLIMGEAVRSKVLLDPQRPAWLEATFAADPDNKALQALCERHDVRPVDGELFFAKEILPQGAARSFACGRRVNASVIREFRGALIDFTSQREQVKLFAPSEQLLYLDTFGGLLELRTQVQERFLAMRQLRRELEELRRAEADRHARIDLFRYQAEELDALGLLSGEDEQLESEFNRLSHAGEILSLASAAEQDLYESDNAVMGRLQEHAAALQPFAADCASCGEAHQSLMDAMAALDSTVAGLRSIPDEVSVDRERLDQVEGRLDVLNRLKQKYSRNLEGLLAYRAEIGGELESASSQQDSIAKLEIEEEQACADLLKLTSELSTSRREHASVLCRRLEENLHRLAIPQAVCELHLLPLQSGGLELEGIIVGSHGAEDAELRIAANPGMAPQPLKAVASGGELSRVLLGLKQLLAGLDRPGAVIFDEIDAGIGGRTADVVGEFIRNIARTHQVLCITHLPQVAAYGKNQFAIEKIVDGAASRIKIQNLNYKERKQEIARMLAGTDSTLALQHAEEILAKGAIGNNYD
ncbi:MAG: DNA repair protein RecN [Candidatus Cloacimonetes bacterium]|nr:DNA repair protein RecN [Candidatus Cloacimonadota bacterium]